MRMLAGALGRFDGLWFDGAAGRAVGRVVGHVRGCLARFAARRPGGERGQSTTEYTLVILVAATIALLLLNWAKGGAIVGFFDSIFEKVVAMFS